MISLWAMAEYFRFLTPACIYYFKNLLRFVPTPNAKKGGKIKNIFSKTLIFLKLGWENGWENHQRRVTP